jgi:hypothetical protein
VIHFSGPFTEERISTALSGYLPYSGEGIQSYDVEYHDDNTDKVMIANFIWINEQWVYLDSREVK